MRKFIFPLLMMAVLPLAFLSCKKDNSGTGELSYVYLNTAPAEEITPVSAKLMADVKFKNFTATGLMELKFFYCQSDTPVERRDMYELGDVTPVKTYDIGDGKFGIVVENLSPGKDYYFMPHLSVLGVSLVSDVLHFKTQDFCVTLETTDVTVTGATVSARAVLSQEERTKAQVGVQWTTTDFDDLPNVERKYVDMADVHEDGTYNCTLTGLNANTRYYVRAVVSMDGKPHYANTLEFKTKSE
ncbi:MAG: hypothetical protein J6X69_07335 [Bacteroidales bacterium]|nr:hypothetical protein [Bacteroidales bacterium]